MQVEALQANSSRLTSLAYDERYETIFSQQLKVKESSKDILIVLSVSENSPNVVSALKVGNDIGMKTYAILRYSGGECKKLAKYHMHFEIDDMQISEDLQLKVGHMSMQWLVENGKGVE